MSNIRNKVIEEIKKIVVEDKWLIFNHFEWHSVQKTNPNSLRINVGVDFNTLSAQDISNLFQKNSI